jgi:hypothetical protein
MSDLHILLTAVCCVAVFSGYVALCEKLAR